MKNSLFSGLSEAALKMRKKKAQPQFVQPMLAVLTKDYFSSEDWFYEHKYDGERCLAFKKNGKVRLVSRNDKSMKGEYPELVIALEKQTADNFIIDGEIVALNKKGISDFELLQGRINLQNLSGISSMKKQVLIYYRIFDLIYAGGYLLTELPLYARKDLLKKLLKFTKMLTFSEYIRGNGIPLFKKACRLGWEGVMAKRAEGPYVPKRSRDWLKFKCSQGQELVIGGYTEPQGSRSYFGALLVGYYKNEELYYAGKVGTGYSHETLEMLGKKLRRLTAKQCPFVDYAGPVVRVHWVKPVLVAEFQFAQWTNAGKLRVGRYKGLRDDKDAKDVVREA